LTQCLFVVLLRRKSGELRLDVGLALLQGDLCLVVALGLARESVGLLLMLGVLTDSLMEFKVLVLQVISLNLVGNVLGEALGVFLGILLRHVLHVILDVLPENEAAPPRRHTP